MQTRRSLGGVVAIDLGGELVDALLQALGGDEDVGSEAWAGGFGMRCGS